MITCKEIETRLYPDRDKERMGSRNIVADMLHDLEMILARRNLHAENIFKCGDNQVEMPAYKQEDKVSLSEQFDLTYDYVFESLREYKSYWAYRQNIPWLWKNRRLSGGLQIFHKSKKGKREYSNKRIFLTTAILYDIKSSKAL